MSPIPLANLRSLHSASPIHVNDAGGDNTVYVVQQKGDVQTITSYTFPLVKNANRDSMELWNNVMNRVIVKEASTGEDGFSALQTALETAKRSSPHCSRFIEPKGRQTEATQVFAFGPNHEDTVNKVPMLHNYTGSQAQGKCVVPTGLGM